MLTNIILHVSLTNMPRKIKMIKTVLKGKEKGKAYKSTYTASTGY